MFSFILFHFYFFPKAGSIQWFSISQGQAPGITHITHITHQQRSVNICFEPAMTTTEIFPNEIKQIIKMLNIHKHYTLLATPTGSRTHGHTVSITIFGSLEKQYVMIC